MAEATYEIAEQGTEERAPKPQWELRRVHVPRLLRARPRARLAPPTGLVSARSSRGRSAPGTPVMPRPAGPSRNATTSATSAGSSSRFTACRSRITSSSTRCSSRPCARAWSAICASTSGVLT